MKEPQISQRSITHESNFLQKNFMWNIFCKRNNQNFNISNSPYDEKEPLTKNA